MIVRETAIAGAFIIESRAAVDARGSFARIFDRFVFAVNGLLTDFDQESVSRTLEPGTIRGLHYQLAPHDETKLVSCVSGAAFDAIVDLRPGIKFGRHVTFELRADQPTALYIPAGCAHGFQTRAPDTVLVYRIHGAYAPDAARGVHYADPSLAIPWPLPARLVSERDGRLPLLPHHSSRPSAESPLHAAS